MTKSAIALARNDLRNEDGIGVNDYPCFTQGFPGTFPHMPDQFPAGSFPTAHLTASSWPHKAPVSESEPFDGHPLLQPPRKKKKATIRLFDEHIPKKPGWLVLFSVYPSGTSTTDGKTEHPTAMTRDADRCLAKLHNPA